MSYRKEIKRIYQTEGIKGFSRGYQGLLIRDGPGFAIYFCTFEALKRKFGVSEKDRIDHHYYGMSQTDVNLRKFLSGGLSGCMTWTIAYPADTIKTNMQSCTKGEPQGALTII